MSHRGGHQIASKKKQRKTSTQRLTSEQLDVLCSPVRVTLYETIQQRDGISVAGLAKETGKSVHSLYFHIRLLKNAGLIRVREFQRKGKRDEAIYEVVSARLVIRKDNSNPAYVESLIKTVRVALRKAEKEHAAARIRNAESELHAILRIQANLKINDAIELRDKIKDLGNWVRKHERPGIEPGTEAVGITCLIVPFGNRS